MALLVSYTAPYGTAAHSTAYAMITSVSITCEPTTAGYGVHINVAIFVNAAARDKDERAAVKSVIGNVSFAITPGSTAFNTYFAETVLDDADKTLLKQAYAYIKTQTSPGNFTSATDV